MRLLAPRRVDVLRSSVVWAVGLAVLLLADALDGGVLTALLSCLAFVTLLAVAAGLTLAAASSPAHDLYGEVIRKGRASETEELTVARLSAVSSASSPMLLALVSWGANIATLAFLAFAIAASAIGQDSQEDAAYDDFEVRMPVGAKE